MAFERESTFLEDASQQNTANLADWFLRIIFFSRYIPLPKICPPLWHHPTPKDHDFNKFENKLPKDAQGS